ncbi:motility associated factor glycosyltransferase family protein [Alicyclobacillus ferrooxydans]|nr:6-hydroxymethylpterin diphosphokinase MptE-like protein [Alicyclobacillus ferrooxydans]
MNFLERNLESLGNNNAQMIAELIANCEFPTNRKCERSSTGVMYYRHEHDRRWMHLTSAYAPEEEAARQCERLLHDTTSSLCFVLGEAGFYHVEEILKRVSSKTFVVLVSSKPEHLKLVLQSRDLSGVLSDYRLIFAVDSDEKVVHGFLNEIVTRHPKKMPTFTVFEHPVEGTLQSQFCKGVKEHLAWLFRTLISNFHTAALYEEYWAENFMLNIPYFINSKVITDLEDSWMKKPVIIVGAGPSLEKNIHLLHRAKGRALIVCCDTAYRIMKRHDIVPDLIVTVDGTPANAEHMAGIDYSDAPLLADYYSHYDIIANHKNNKIFIETIDFHQNWWDKVSPFRKQKASIVSGGSVATLAFSFARRIGANPIILIGVDLSYPGGMYYAKGAIHDDRTVEDVKKTRQLIEVTDLNGSTTYTTSDYYYYLQWFERQAKESTDGRLYINATEGGALKEGFQISTLREVIDRYCDNDANTQAWMELLASKPVDPALIAQTTQNIKRSYFETKGLVNLSAILIKRLEQFVLTIADGKYADIPEMVSFIQKGYAKTMRLQYALTFINGQAHKTAWKDHLVETVMEDGRDSLTERERAIASAHRTLDLFRDFYRVAQDTVQLHRRGLAVLKQTYQTGEASMDEC